ncbi:MAG TPA: hypothetical protein VI603_11455 [Saprospiraceae bacterium]|nr:hypothetical protein [Saprospiraceae bacterium]
MKKLLFLLLLVPILGMSQTKNVVSTFRAFPKVDKVLEFEAALAAHAQKYHTGDWRWRVFEISSGPDYGGYHITEGPTSWTAFDTRGNLGTEHNNDWNRKVAIYLTDKQSTNGYFAFQDSLSTVGISDYADNIIINHIYPKPGMVLQTGEMIGKQRKVWAAGNESVAVYTAVNSGPQSFAVVTRLKGGLKELEPGYRAPFPQRFDAVNGEGAWGYYLEDYAKYVESRWSEMLSLRADLSSK